MYFVYLIQCEDGSIYTGITNDLERRFKEHEGKAGGHYTRAHKVEKILYTEKYPTRSEALKREAEIKKLRREEKLNLVKKQKNYQKNCYRLKSDNVALNKACLI